MAPLELNGDGRRDGRCMAVGSLKVFRAQGLGLRVYVSVCQSGKSSFLGTKLVAVQALMITAAVLGGIRSCYLDARPYTLNSIYPNQPKGSLTNLPRNPLATRNPQLLGQGSGLRAYRF